MRYFICQYTNLYIFFCRLENQFVLFLIFLPLNRPFPFFKKWKNRVSRGKYLNISNIANIYIQAKKYQTFISKTMRNFVSLNLVPGSYAKVGPLSERSCVEWSCVECSCGKQNGGEIRIFFLSAFQDRSLITLFCQIFFDN